VALTTSSGDSPTDFDRAVTAPSLEDDCAKAAELRGQKKAIEAALEPIDERIMAGCFERGQTSYVIPGWKANIENKTTRTISREKLVARGVDVDLIDGATDVTVSKAFVKFYALKS